jgi:multicomponent Na+:H+ antiporter subunit B
MNTLILRCAARYMHPIFLLFSIFLLMRGHNEPGGGFTGGLVAASSFALYAIAYSPADSRRVLWFDPHMLIGCGLLLAVSSAILPMFLGQPFMTGQWWDLPVIGALGTPVFFDIGVYLDVVGVTVLIIYSLAEEDAEHWIGIAAEDAEE